MVKKRVIYFIENWKMVIHLLFKTKRFGVNNKLWSERDSIFGVSCFTGWSQAVKNYKMVKVRAFSGFIPLNQAIDLFPKHAKKHGYKSIDKKIK
ncbi:MAG: hypothetical protein HQK74_10225 [Desulfamplus sp.]|nr:hypothetical protein [Desulfamplus sp.]MBF0209681.1 hypothetical protein [Desulfamplus sp.]MBF0390521.1 hypothetical protein [Desulfamplus sp.]